MPVQKLTKARVIQLIIALIILICAFLYRTYYYPNNQSMVEVEHIEQ